MFSTSNPFQASHVNNRRRGSVYRGGVALLGAMLAVAACIGAASDTNTRAVSEASSVQRFADLMVAQREVDYTPLASPDEAVKKADLVVVGRMRAASEGLRIATPGENGAVAMWMATLHVTVTEVISGTTGEGELILQTFVDPMLKLDAIEEALPTGSVLLVLDDITSWRPFPDAEITYPAGIDKTTKIYFPYTDGMWFDTSEGLRGMGVTSDEIRARWTGADTFAEMVELFRVAAEKAS